MHVQNMNFSHYTEKIKNVNRFFKTHQLSNRLLKDQKPISYDLNPDDRSARNNFV